MAWFEYLTDSLKKFFLKKSISDFENETENEEEGCVELELLINDNAISESFSFRNISINYSVTKTADFNFRYRSISVLPKYRERGVCSYLLLKSIIVVLEALENKDVEFSLVNTVKI